MVQKQGFDVIVHILFLAHLVHALTSVSHHHGSLVFGLFSIFVSTLVAGLGLGSRKIDGSHIRNNNQCSYKLTSITRLGGLYSLGSEDDVH